MNKNVIVPTYNLSTAESDKSRSATIVSTRSTLKPELKNVEYSDFKPLTVIGKGACGKVILSELNINK